MDGLSLAANIIAVVDITVKVGLICSEYLQALKDAKSDINRLHQEVQDYRSVLDNVQKLLDKSPEGARLSATRDLQQTISQTHLELVRIYDRLDRSRNIRSNAAGLFGSRVLKWPFEKRELDMMIAKLNGQKQTISLALAIDHT